ncbi:inorganic phosphate transporter [Saliphagus infecundisoli]|uniref:inorganic phosphate transporter n=1 Tax=Saliphagus infecundisoli TaxID=1849069 RepID=UPI003CCE490B
MVEVSSLVVGAAATRRSLFMAWTIRAGPSGSTPFTPAVGANIISVMRAGFVVGVLGFAGAVLQGATVSETVGSGLIRGVVLSPVAVTVGLFTAKLRVGIDIFTGYLIATAFTVAGTMTGIGFALGGAPVWASYLRIIVLWIAIPFVGGGTAYATTRCLRSRQISGIAAVGVFTGLTVLSVTNMQFTTLGATVERELLASLTAA